MPPVISIVGKSRVGKTTLIEKLIPELKRRGYRIGVVKHAAHQFDMDKEGKDSWRHKAAGADAVMVVSPDQVALVKDQHIVSLADLLPYLDDMDLVITEGFKSRSRPKIEVCRAARNSELLCRDHLELIAVVTDVEVDFKGPVLGLDDITDLADLIENRFLSGPQQDTLA